MLRVVENFAVVFRLFVFLLVTNGVLIIDVSAHPITVMIGLQVIARDAPQQCCVAANNWSETSMNACTVHPT